MRQPHAVIVLPNNIEIDARAQRNGLALTEAGFKVTLLGFGPPVSGEISGIPYHVLHAATKPKKLSFVYRAVRKSFQVTARRRPPREVLKVVAKIDAGTTKVSHSVSALVKKVRPQREIPAADPTTWQGMLPQIPVMERLLMPKLVELEPDLVIPDVHMLNLANTVARRYRTQGRKVAVLYDAREYVYGLASEDRNILEGFPALEAEQIGHCDAVVTVCEPIAEFLKDKYGLPTLPPLVPNAPIAGLPTIGTPMTIRDFLDIDPDSPLLAYAGGLSHHRGVHDVVAALDQLPGVHLAVGARRASSYTLELEELARKRGVSDRVHFVPFAPTHEVAEYLESATAAIIPFLPVGNHNWAAPNKYFEAVQARLPILTSNMEWLSQRVTSLGIGEVFEHSNPDSLAAATRKLLGNLEHYQEKLTDELVAEHTFEHFSHVVKETALAIVPEKLHVGLRPQDTRSNLRSMRRDMLGQRARLSDSDLFEPRPRLRIGTTNSGGQAMQWAHALMRDHPRIIAESAWLLTNQPMGFPVDEVITAQQQVTTFWQTRMKAKLEDRVTHVLHESARPLIGSAFGSRFWQESTWFKERGIRQGLVFHGSDIRNPRRHAELEEWSPFRGEMSEEMADLTAALQKSVDRITPHVQAFDGPVYVTTADLLDYLPNATLLPLTVDTDAWASDRVPLGADEPPMVFHVPNKVGLKGSDAVDELCYQLEAEGRIRYIRESNIPHRRMRELMLRSDIVIDQLRIADYGLTAVEAMGAGRVVVGNISDRVATRHPGNVPIVRATPATLGQVLEAVLSDKVRAAELGRAGREYVLQHHDGHAAARVLAQFMQD